MKLTEADIINYTIAEFAGTHTLKKGKEHWNNIRDEDVLIVTDVNGKKETIFYNINCSTSEMKYKYPKDYCKDHNALFTVKQLLTETRYRNFLEVAIRLSREKYPNRIYTWSNEMYAGFLDSYIEALALYIIIKGKDIQNAKHETVDITL